MIREWLLIKGKRFGECVCNVVRSGGEYVFLYRGRFFLELLYGIRIFPKVLIVFAGSRPAHRVDIVPLGTIEAQGCARWTQFGPHPMGKRDLRQRQAVVVV